MLSWLVCAGRGSESIISGGREDSVHLHTLLPIQIMQFPFNCTVYWFLMLGSVYCFMTEDQLTTGTRDKTIIKTYRPVNHIINNQRRPTPFWNSWISRRAPSNLNTNKTAWHYCISDTLWIYTREVNNDFSNWVSRNYSCDVQNALPLLASGWRRF